MQQIMHITMKIVFATFMILFHPVTRHVIKAEAAVASRSPGAAST
jgi:hypothetical protein